MVVLGLRGPGVIGGHCRGVTVFSEVEVTGFLGVGVQMVVDKGAGVVTGRIMTTDGGLGSAGVVLWTVGVTGRGG